MRNSLPQGDRLALTLAALAAVPACAAHSLVDFGLHVPANAMLLAFDEKNPVQWLHLGQAHASLAEANTNAAAACKSWQAAAVASERGLCLYPHEQPKR